MCSTPGAHLTYARSVAWRPSSPEEWEIARRSASMLTPNQPALDREAALHLYGELDRLARRDKQFARLLKGLRTLLAEVDDSRPGPSGPTG